MPATSERCPHLVQEVFDDAILLAKSISDGWQCLGICGRPVSEPLCRCRPLAEYRADVNYVQ